MEVVGRPSQALVAELGVVVPRLGTLEKVVRWALEQGAEVDVVAQDEFTHDVLVALPGGTLVLDCTWLGEVTAVAVWQHHPSPAMLLGRRLAVGWRARPSPLVEGPRVLGYAALVSQAS